jgi:hypothetical protein
VTNARAARRHRLERGVLLAPDFLSRAAAKRAALPEERWLLAQPREVRESYVREVHDGRGDPELLRQVWMMRQPPAVRESYVREILEPEIVRSRGIEGAA